MADQEYKGWIPTNSGILRPYFREISQSENKDDEYLFTETTKKYSDTIDKKRLKAEIALTYTITIQHNKSPWCVELDLSVAETEIANAKGTIKENGIIELKISVEQKFSENPNIPNTIYTIIKNHVHLDNGHDQKVDTIIPFKKIDEFSYSAIARNLTKNIKQFEMHIKRVEKNKNWFKTRSSHFKIQQLSHSANIFCSYLEAFLEIFKQEIEDEQKQPNPIFIGSYESIIKSINQLQKRSDDDFTHSKFGLTIIFSLMAVSFAIIMLFKPSNGFDYLAEEVPKYVIFVAVAMAAIILHIKFFNSFISNEMEEIGQRIYLQGMTTGKPTNKLLYYFLRYGKYIFGIIFVSMCVYAFMHLNNIDKQNDMKTNINRSTPKDTNKSSMPKAKIQYEQNKTVTKITIKS